MRQARTSIKGYENWAVAAVVAGVLAIGLPAIGLPHAGAQYVDSGGISREYKIKAAFLYNFGHYVQWPAQAFGDAQAAFVIGVLGPSPVTADLRRIAETKQVQERPIRVRQFSEVEEVAACHILFFPAAVEPEMRAEAIRRCSGSPVLLVGENRDFLDQGGMVDLVIEQNRVRVYIALKAAQQAGLTVSSKLLRVAEVVD